MENGTYNQRNAVFCAAAELLYGHRWGRQLAANLQCPQSTIASIASGRRAVTPALEARLAALIEHDVAEWQKHIHELAQLRAQLAATTESDDENEKRK